MKILRSLMTEKTIKLIELENKIVFEVSRNMTKAEIAKEIEKMFKVKVKKVNTHIRNNKKIAFIKLKQETPASDIATKLGVI